MEDAGQGRAYLIGDICVDLSLIIPAEMGNAHGQEEPDFGGGGTVANTAFGLARLGVDTTFVGCVGDDYAGRYAVQELAAEGVRVDGVHVSRERPTPQVISLASAEGQRTTFLWPSEDPAYSELDLSMIPRLYLRPRDWLHTSGICLVGEKAAPVTIAALRKAQEAGCRSSFDLSLRFGMENGMLSESFRENLWEAMGLASVVLGSVEEELLNLLPHEKDPARATRILAERTDSTAIMRDAVDGAIVSERGAPCQKFPRMNVPSLDTLGAGDAFAAGFILGAIKGMPASQGVPLAHAVAGFKVGGRGARHLPTPYQLRDFGLLHS